MSIAHVPITTSLPFLGGADCVSRHSVCATSRQFLQLQVRELRPHNSPLRLSDLRPTINRYISAGLITRKSWVVDGSFDQDLRMKTHRKSLLAFRNGVPIPLHIFKPQSSKPD
ncbi:MAG: hypothetical protein AAF497_19595, partial [Planctomycetota bacterium]